MYKKLLISLSVLAIAIFSFSFCLANDGMQDAANGVRDVVGGAENAVEDAARDISNTSKDATGNMEQGANNAGNTIMNNNDNNNNNDSATAKDTNNRDNDGIMSGNYTATRTASTESTFMGMNATTWTWLILGIAGIAIIALVWYYSSQLRSANYNEKE